MSGRVYVRQIATRGPSGCCAVVEDGTPTGGFFRDGRASSLEVQAQQPFISAFEMANADAAEVRARLLASPATLQLFEAAFADAPLTNAAATLTATATTPRAPPPTPYPDSVCRVRRNAARSL